MPMPMLPAFILSSQRIALCKTLGDFAYTMLPLSISNSASVRARPATSTSPACALQLELPPGRWREVVPYSSVTLLESRVHSGAQLQLATHKPHAVTASLRVSLPAWAWLFAGSCFIMCVELCTFCLHHCTLCFVELARTCTVRFSFVDRGKSQLNQEKSAPGATQPDGHHELTEHNTCTFTQPLSAYFISGC